MGKSSTFQISLKLLTQEFTKGLNNIQKQLKSFGNFVRGAFGLTALVTFGRKVVETGAQFEDAMARVQAVSNATAGEMAMMTKEAEKLGSTTKYTAAEAAGALENLTRNGLSASEATQTLSGTLKLAQANAIGLAEAANIITNTMNIFGLTVKDTNRINDVLSATCANSATNITDLSEAIKGVGPIATTMGKSIEETTAALGVLANRGVTGSEAGKALGAMFQRLAAQSPKAAAELKRYGLSIDETTLKTKSLDEILKILADSGIGKSQAALDKIFGKNYSAKVGVLINSVEEFNKQLEITQNAAGTTERMFNQGVGSTENAIKSLQSAYEGFLNSIFKQTSGVLNSVIKGLTNLVRALSDTRTRTVAIVGTIASVLTIKFVGAMNKVKAKALETKIALTTLQAGIKTVTAAAKAAYAAMGGWVGILMTIGTTIATYFVDKARKANEVVREMTELQASYTGEAQNSINAVDRLLKLAEDEHIAMAVRQKAVDELNNRIKGLNATIDDEGKLIVKNKGKIDDYKKAVLEAAAVEGKRSQLNTLYNKKAMAELAILDKAQREPGFWDKAQAYVLAFLKTNMAKAGTAQAGQGLHGEYENILNDRWLKDVNNELDIIETLIAQIEKDITPEQWAAIYGPTSDTSTGFTFTPGSGSSDTPEETLDKAKDKFDTAIKEAASRIESKSAKVEDVIDDVISACKSLIDAYVKYAAATGDNSIFESDEYKEVLETQNKLKKFTEALANVRKEQSEKEESWKKLDEGLSRLGAKQGKNSVQNPWDNFSSNPKEYRDEEREVQRLQTELENLVSTYESLKDVMENIGEPQNDKQVESLKKWNALLAEINEKTAEYQQKANALGSKKAMDEINEKTIDQRRAYYDMIRNTSSAVGQLTSNLQSLSEADWGTMSFAEKFNTISNAIFGTIDAVLNVIDTFRSLQEIIDSLTMAKTAYAAIEEATSKQQQKNAEAEGAAALAKGADELAAAQMSMIAGEVDKEVKRGVVAANSASAISGAAAAMASIPYVGPFLATAAATEMEALLAAMLPKFASGGIIQGSSKYGDRLLARVNAGEMILNAQQQKRLFDIANGHGGLGAGQVSFHIAGKDLVGVLRNNNAANAKISGAKGL